MLLHLSAITAIYTWKGPVKRKRKRKEIVSHFPEDRREDIRRTFHPHARRSSLKLNCIILRCIACHFLLCDIKRMELLPSAYTPQIKLFYVTAIVTGRSWRRSGINHTPARLISIHRGTVIAGLPRGECINFLMIRAISGHSILSADVRSTYRVSRRRAALTP